MSAAAKTLDLLKHFSATRVEIGLSRLCKLANRDKATTYRHLQALEDAGFVEKNPQTKQYRLGPAFLVYAQLREQAVPRKDAVKAPLATLADATGETAHVSILSGTTLFALEAVESPTHSARAIVDLQSHPLHATASGLCTLAFGPADLSELARSDLRAFTANTVTTPEQLDALVQATKDAGFSQSDRCFEDEVHGVAVPLFDQTGAFAGTVAVACIASRFTPQREQQIKVSLITAAQSICNRWGGRVPAWLEARWAQALSPQPSMELVK